MSSIMRGLKWFAACATLASIACGGDGASRDAVAKTARSQLSPGDPATLALNVGGAGMGSVELVVGGAKVPWVGCADPSVGQLCATVPVGSSVALTGNADWESSFVGFQAPYCDVFACDWTDPDFMPATPFAWSTVNPYTFTMVADKAVTAMFWPGSPLIASTVTVVVAGTPGAGTIKGAAGGASFLWDVGEECPASATCTSAVPFTPGTPIRLTATPDAATSSFQGFQAPFCEVNDCGPMFDADPEFVPPAYAWTGSPYTFTLDGPRTVNAKFASQTFTLKVSGLTSTYGKVTVTETATIGGAPAQTYPISDLTQCGGFAGCTLNLPVGATVTVSAPQGLNSAGVFSGWSGACSGTGPCSVTLNASKSVTANFVAYQPPVMYSLVTNVMGVASGVTIGRSPNAGSYARTTPLTVVTLTAPVTANYRFVRWYGCDSQSADPGGSTLPPQCKVTMGYSRTVTALYVPTVPITLTVVSGTGTNPAVSIVAGGTTVANCLGGTTCTVNVDRSSSVSVQATSNGIATPVKWAGTCANLVVPGCSIFASAALTATATFP